MVEREYRDKDGRIILLLVNISGQKIILDNLYAPNMENPDFFLQLKKIILDFGDFLVVLGGNFNHFGCIFR